MGSSKWTWIATTVCALVALLAPFEYSYITFEPEMVTAFTLRSLVWIYESYPSTEFIFEPLGLLISPIHAFLRFWFVYEVYRVYSMRVPRRRAVIVGIISEFWWVVPQAYVLIFISFHPMAILPVPVLLLVGLVLLGLRRPARDSGAWIDGSESQQSQSPATTSSIGSC